MCQVWAGIIPVPWWMIKHIWSVLAFPMRPPSTLPAPARPGMGAHSVTRPDLPPAPFLKMNLSHIWGQETARLSATSIWAQWFERYQRDVSKVAQFELHVNCFTMCYCLFFVTTRRALKQWYFFPLRKCYPDDFSFTPGVIGSVNHVSCVGHVPLTCPPVIRVLWQINSLGALSPFSITFSCSLLCKSSSTEIAKVKGEIACLLILKPCRSLDGGEFAGSEFDATGIPTGITLCLTIPGPSLFNNSIDYLAHFPRTLN